VRALRWSMDAILAVVLAVGALNGLPLRAASAQTRHGMAAMAFAARPADRAAAAPGHGVFFATVTPSPFIHVGARARVVVRMPGGEADGKVQVTLRGEPSAFSLSQPTAAERRRGVVALVQAGATPAKATLVVSIDGRPRRLTLPLESFVHPDQLTAGKGAWVSFNTYGQMSAAAMLGRMHQEGITHVYLETGGDRFIERSQLNALLEPAHNLGIAVIAFAWAPLLRLRREIYSAGETITYRAPQGGMVDGFAGDFETNLGKPAVRAFSAAVRHDLGPDRVYVACIYAPQLGFHTPIATLARYVNVFAPMDYWLGSRWGSSAVRASWYVTRSVWDLRHASGEGGRAIEVIAQTADVANPSGIGLLNPSAAQVRASALAARAAGALGVSFYELLTQTRAQIAAIASFRMPANTPG
jgi:hypothetical protein